MQEQNQHTHKKDIQESSGQDLRQSKTEQNLAEQPQNLTQEAQNIQAQYNLFNQIETQQRARFYAKQRNAALHKSNAPAFRDSPKSYANLCGMPQSNVAYSKQSPRENNQVLLPNNAQHNLSGNTHTRTESKQRDDDRACRWTIGTIQELAGGELNP